MGSGSKRKSGGVGKLVFKGDKKNKSKKSRTSTILTSNELVYREKSSTGTSYVIRREALNRDMSRGDLLTMRSKKKSDRYC